MAGDCSPEFPRNHQQKEYRVRPTQFTNVTRWSAAAGRLNAWVENPPYECRRTLLQLPCYWPKAENAGGSGAAPRQSPIIHHQFRGNR